MRQARLPQSGRWAIYDSLAGHVECGEGVADTVRRVSAAEAGVSVGEVRYSGSQPWPLPYTLMLAYVARAAAVSIDVVRGELEDAIWVTLARLQAIVDVRAEDHDGVDGGAARESRDEVVRFVPSTAPIGGQMIHALLAQDEICRFRASA